MFNALVENKLTLVDQAASSRNLLELLEYIDRILEIWGKTRKYERIAAVVFFHQLAHLGLMADRRYTMKTLNEMITLRNVRLEQDDYRKIFSSPYREPQRTTELDLLFLNAPSVFGHQSRGRLNFYVEVEMHGGLGQATNRVMNLVEYFREKLKIDLFPVIVYESSKEFRWGTVFIDMHDLEKMVDYITLRSLNDIPGVGYEWATTAIRILNHIASSGEIDRDRLIGSIDGLWSLYPELRQHSFKTLISTGRLSQYDYEDFRFQFIPRVHNIFGKMVEKGLLTRNREDRYVLTEDGRDLLACYLKFGRMK